MAWVDEFEGTGGEEAIRRWLLVLIAWFVSDFRMHFGLLLDDVSS